MSMVLMFTVRKKEKSSFISYLRFLLYFFRLRFEMLINRVYNIIISGCVCVCTLDIHANIALLSFVFSSNLHNRVMKISFQRGVCDKFELQIIINIII